MQKAAIALLILCATATSENATATAMETIGPDMRPTSVDKVVLLSNNKSVADSAVVNRTELNALAKNGTLTQYIVDWEKVGQLTAGSALTSFIGYIHKDAILKKIAIFLARFTGSAVGIKALAILAVTLVFTGIILGAFLYAVQVKVVHEDSIALGYNVQQAGAEVARINHLLEGETSKVSDLQAQLSASATSHEKIRQDLQRAKNIIKEQREHIENAKKDEETRTIELRRMLQDKLRKIQEERETTEQALAFAEGNRDIYKKEYDKMVAQQAAVEQAFEEKQMVLYTYSISVYTAWKDVVETFTSAAKGNTTQFWRFWDAAREALKAPITHYKKQMSLLEKVKKPEMEKSSATTNYLQPGWSDTVSTVLLQKLDWFAAGAVTVGVAAAPASVAFLGFGSMVPVVTVGSATFAGVATVAGGHFAKKALHVRLWPVFEDLLWNMAWWICLVTALFSLLAIVSFYVLGMAKTIPIKVIKTICWIVWKCICYIVMCCWAIIWSIVKFLCCRKTSTDTTNTNVRSTLPEARHVIQNLNALADELER